MAMADCIYHFRNSARHRSYLGNTSPPSMKSSGQTSDRALGSQKTGPLPADEMSWTTNRRPVTPA
jgi:hypothetical protein